MTRRRITSVLAALGILVACDGGSASFVPFILFTYAGAASGTYDSKGTPGSDETKPWSMAFRDQTNNGMFLIGNMPRAGGTTHIVAIGFPASQGSFNFDAACDDSAATVTCGSLLLLIGSNTSTGESVMVCLLESGSLVVTSITEERVAGTFSGNGSCQDASATAAGALTITNGSFDVTLSAQPLS